MATMGRPVSNEERKFQDIQIKRPVPKTVQELQETDSQGNPLKVGDSLNKAAGVKPETRFVDRKTKETMGADGFMKLLAHQLQNQDPMKPMDQKDFSANLAQFSQLEQLTNMNKKMESMTANNTTEKKFLGAGFLGKKVVTKGTTLDYAGDGRNIEIPFFLDKNAKNAIIRVYDAKNQMIAEIQKEGLSKGMQSISWDGIGLDGQIAPKETYQFNVLAFGENNEKFMADTRAEGTVAGVNFDENGETVFTLQNGKKVFLRDVESFSMGGNSDSIGKKVPTLQKDASNAYNQLENQFN